MKNKLILFFVFILFASSLHARKSIPNKRVLLDSGWEYSMSEKPLFYTPLSNKNFHQLASLYNYKSGYIWLKKTVIIHKSLETQNIYLYLGNTKIADIVYFNGYYIGSSGSMPPHAFPNGELVSYYPIPSDFIKYGEENTILIKLYVDSFGKLGEIPYIGLENNVVFAAKVHNLLSSELPFTIALFLIAISIFYMFFFTIRPVDVSNRTFSLLCLASSLYLIGNAYGELPGILFEHISYLNFHKIFTGLVPFITMYFAVSFIQDYLGKTDSYRRTLYRNFSTILVCVVPLFAQNLYQFFAIVFFCYIFYSCQFIYSIKTIITCFKEKNRNLKSLLLGFTPILISLPLALLLFFIWKFQYVKFVVIFGWQITIFTFLCFLLINYVKLLTRVEFVNTNLEKLVHEKTEKLQEANSILEETNTNLEYQKKRTERELQLAAFVQQNFFHLNKTNFKKWNIDFYFKPLASVSGDLYDIYTNHDELNGFGIFDVSGHGISSGLVTMLVKNIIQQEFSIGLDDNLTDVLDRINERVIYEKGNIENYLTGIIGRIKGNKIQLVNAGHPKAIWVHKDGTAEYINNIDSKQCSVIGIEGIPTNFTHIDIDIKKGDSILLYTDGIIEAQNQHKDYYGKDNLLATVINHYNKDRKLMLDAIKDDLLAYIGRAEITDDITMMMVTKL